MDKENKRRIKFSIIGILGVVALLIGTSFAAFQAELIGTEEQTINTGCLKVEMTDSNSLNLDNEVPESDSDGLKKTPYVYTLTNTCSTDAYYVSTLNITNDSNLANLSKVKVSVGGDSYLKPTIINDLEKIALVDKTETDVARSYKLDEGYLIPGESKEFRLRSWIDYDVEEFTGNISSKVIVKSESRANGIIDYKTNTSGYQATKGNSIIANAAYNIESPSENQPTGIVKVGEKAYYRGNPTNNYVSFANKTWRILSTNSDGSTNIVLDTPTTTTTYSNITSALNTFYNGISSEAKYIKTDSTFCEEKTSSGTYLAKTRLEGNNPSITCASNNVMTKIGLLSVDDLMYAGAVNGKTNSAVYLASQNAYWTNSWSTSSTVYTYAAEFQASSTSASKYLKPVITLSKEVILEGEGTSEKPFTIKGLYSDTDTNEGESDLRVIYARVDDKWSTKNKNIEISATSKNGIAGYYIGTSNTKPTSGWETTTSKMYTSQNSYDNGTYYVFVKDKDGNVSEGQEVVISKVDKVLPTCTIKIEPGDSLNKYKTLTVTGSDDNGIDPNGYSWNLSDEQNDVIKANANETYIATVTDLAGNKNTCSANVDGIDDGSIHSVKVVIKNGTVDVPEKRVNVTANATFNISSTASGATPTVTCTNNQKGTITGNALTVNSVTKDTTCTVSYEKKLTTLYNDGTLVINDHIDVDDLNSDSIVATWAPLSTTNQYVFEDETSHLWYLSRLNITNVKLGEKISPLSTAYWFMNATKMFKGDFSNLDTSNVTNMSNMFNGAGSEASMFELKGLENWDTSNVTDMTKIFRATGKEAWNWNIGDISNWDTSNVTSMQGMFTNAGQEAPFKLNLSKWDTSNVTSMQSMFENAGKNSETWDIGDISNWNTSKVTTMKWMFLWAGTGASKWDIGNLANWDISSVTTTQSMFCHAGETATEWNIGNLSNWDTSNVTSMQSMFDTAGSSATTWDIGDISNWNTSKVTSMKWMFVYAGLEASIFNIGTLKNWDTSNVTDMYEMFNATGHKQNSLNIDLSNWDISNVTDVYGMFYEFSSINTPLSDWIVKIPRKTGTIDNSLTSFYGADSTVEAIATGTKKFTLKFKAEVKVNGGNLLDDSVKYVWSNATKSVSFDSEAVGDFAGGTVSCTNGQTGELSDSRITINNVSNDTVCTVTYN